MEESEKDSLDPPRNRDAHTQSHTQTHTPTHPHTMKVETFVARVLCADGVQQLVLGPKTIHDLVGQQDGRATAAAMHPHIEATSAYMTSLTQALTH